MGHAITAEELIAEVKNMPTAERARFFAMLGENAFRDGDYTHEQVFGQLAHDEFTANEAAEYLEVSIPTFRRYVQKGKLQPSNIVGRNQMFATRDLKIFKRSLRVVKQGSANT